MGLESVSIRRIQCIRYDVLGFLGVGTTFDFFQYIHLLYFQYGILDFSGYGVLIMFPLWYLVWEIDVSLDVVTNNVAEYPAVVLGLRYALDKEFRHIVLAKESKDKLLSFEICHVAGRQMSVVHIKHGETTERGKPKIARLSDPMLRTIDRKMKCETFMANVAELLCDACASIAPRSLRMSFEFILKQKHEFCYNLLGYVAIEYSDLLLIDLLEDHIFNQARKIRNPKNRLKKILDACKSKSKCLGGDEIVSQNQDIDEPVKKSRGGCGAQQPKITIEGMKMVAEQLPEPAERKQQLSAKRVLSVLKWISDEDCLLLGLNPKYARLDWMVLPIPPPPVRPSVMMDTSARSEASFSILLFRRLLQFHVATYFDNELPGQPRCTVLHSSITTETIWCIAAALEGVSESYLEEPEESAEFAGRKEMTVLPYCGFPARYCGQV
ncbi:DNA-directed RNA polymerase II subunit 1 [Tanacetum coccineum]